MARLDSRALDCYLDKTYTVGGAKDRFRDEVKAAGPGIERVPEYGNYFSDLPTHPSKSGRLKRTAPSLPAWAKRAMEEEHQRGETQAEAQTRSSPDMVTGAQRMTFVHRPMLTGLSGKHGEMPGVVYDKRAKDASKRGLRAARKSKAVAESEKTEMEPGQLVDAGVQSVFRESEAQTLPYTPNHRIPSDDEKTAKQKALENRHNCDQPEVLEIADLKYFHGLPPGQAEVEAIEKRREKRGWEKSLPELHDMHNLSQRRQMMEEREVEEWAERERELEELANERLEGMQMALKRRAEAQVVARNARLADERERKARAARRVFDNISRSRVREMRKMDSRRKASHRSPSFAKTTLADKLVHPASHLHAPLPRDGATTISHLPSHTLPRFSPSTSSELERAEGSAMKWELNEPLTKPQKLEEKERRTTKDRRAISLTNDVYKVGDALDRSKAEHGRRGVGSCWPQPVETISPVSQRRMVEGRRPERPATPEAGMPERGHPSFAAAVLLQRLLRGKAVQVAMVDGRNRRIDLIRELQQEEPPPVDLDRDFPPASGEALTAAGAGLSQGLRLVQ